MLDQLDDESRSDITFKGVENLLGSLVQYYSGVRSEAPRISMNQRSQLAAVSRYLSELEEESAYCIGY
jgi:hypothetical protein